MFCQASNHLKLKKGRVRLPIQLVAIYVQVRVGAVPRADEMGPSVERQLLG
jgi:hypothetical protein